MFEANLDMKIVPLIEWVWEQWGNIFCWAFSLKEGDMARLNTMKYLRDYNV